MKNIYYLTLAMAFLFVFCQCNDDSKNDPSFEENEVPAIFIEWQENIVLDLGGTIELSPKVSPDDATTYKWILDGEVISTEKKLSFKPEKAGDFVLYFFVERYGIQNFRYANVYVLKPFEEKTYNKKSVAFLTKEGDVNRVNWDATTHLVLASSVVNIDGSLDKTLGATNIAIDPLIATAHEKGIYVLLEYSGKLINYLTGIPAYNNYDFYKAAINPGIKDKLIKDMIDFANERGFDGINIHMDKSTTQFYDNPDELKTFYQALADAVPDKTKVGKFHLTMSLSSGYTRSALQHLVDIERYDWVHVMAYGEEYLSPKHHASDSYFDQEASYWYNTMSLSKDKIVMVAPAFSLRYFGDEVLTWGNLWKYTDYRSYQYVCDTYPGAENKDKVDIDKGLFYDGLPSIGRKAKYVLDNDLAGMALWAVDKDATDTRKSLHREINEKLGN